MGTLTFGLLSLLLTATQSAVPLVAKAFLHEVPVHRVRLVFRNIQPNIVPRRPAVAPLAAPTAALADVAADRAADRATSRATTAPPAVLRAASLAISLSWPPDFTYSFACASQLAMS